MMLARFYSSYSLLYGVRPVGEMVKEAASLGYEAIALTDINNLYGVHDFLEACRAHGVRAIIGAELRAPGGRAVFLAKNRDGFSSLTRLISERMTEPDFDLARSLVLASSDAIVLCDEPGLLETLRGAVPELYAMLTPRSRRAAFHAKRFGLPVVGLVEACLLEPGDHRLHRVLRAIARRTRLSAVSDGDCVSKDSRFAPAGDAEAMLADMPDSIENSRKIANSIEQFGLFNGFVFPSFRTGGETHREALRRAAYSGAEVRYGELSESVLERLDYELGIIEAKGFSSYFLAVADIVRRSSLTCGRGSAAASIVAYCLGITNVDPLRHHLYFERFLNPQRIDPPDIDVDFAWDERDALFEEVVREYGEDHCARVCNIVHFRERSALRETARAYGIPEEEISEFEKRLLRESMMNEGGAIDATWREIIMTARRIIGLPRHLSVHVGGLVMTPEPVDRYAPVERTPGGARLLTWDKDGAECAGLVKIDLLGNRSLAVVRDALINLRENGIRIDPLRWNPLHDKKTIDLLARGDTMGVFYVESPAMRQLQKKTKRGDFEHLVIHSSIIRPAANRFIAEYVERLRGKSYAPLHPRLESILAETYGIMCYQEDVSKTAVALAGFSDADADGLRKILTKKNREARLAQYREQFFEGARRNGVEEAVIDEIWAMVLSFDGYSFCKAHSASYAMLSFQSAYLRAHHPAEFMAAVLSNGGGYYSAAAYVSECRRMGLRVLPPDVNRSRIRYWGKERSVRVGFMAIRELRRDTAEAIVREREAHGPYRSVGELAGRAAIHERDAEALVSCGALDSLAAEAGRAQQLRSLLRMIKRNSAVESFYQPGLFAGEERAPLAPAVREKPMELLEQEYKRLGFLCAGHPLLLWKKEIAGTARIRAKSLPRHLGKDVIIIGWPVAQKEILTVDGNPMQFVSFEDETALYETVLFPEAYRRFNPRFGDERPFLVRGSVENDQGALYVNVKELRPLRAKKAVSS